MSIVDVAIVIAVGVGVVRGFSTGLIRQIVGLAGFILALVLALELMAFVAGLVGPALGLGELPARVVGFLLVFAIVQIAISLLARLAEATAGALKLTVLNRIGGGVAGGVKAVLLASVALVLLARLDVPNEDGRQGSTLYGPTVLLVPTVWDLAAEAWPRIETLSSRFGDEVRSYWSDEE